MKMIKYTGKKSILKYAPWLLKIFVNAAIAPRPKFAVKLSFQLEVLQNSAH